MPARVIKADTTELMRVALEEAKEVIISGGVVALPTETFYGLAVNVTDEEALRRLMAAKKRPENNPILILIPFSEALEFYTVSVPPVAVKLIKQFWPGGLTIVFQAKPELSPLLTAGTGKIGVRLSSHPLPTQLARLAGVAITGTSANISCQPACRNVDEVMQVLGNDIDLVLDGGETLGGKGSTVLDVTLEPPLVIRGGMVPREEIEKLIGSLRPVAQS